MNGDEDELFDYQLTGASWLSERKLALLADEMGVGKTAQVIRAADQIQAERILVICPAVARINWMREFARFSKIARECSVVMGLKPIKTSSPLLVTSYDLATTFHLKNLDTLKKNSWDLLILDEMHYLKSPTASRTKAIFGKTGLIRYAKRCWALSGTPAPNHAGELWPLLYTFGLTPYQYDEFVERYCTGYQGPHGFRVTGNNQTHLPELKTTLSKLMLRRKKIDVVKQLPPIHFDHVTVEPGPVDIDVHFVQYTFPYDNRHELAEKLEKERRLLTSGLEATKVRSENGLKLLEAIAKSLSTLRRYTGLQKVQAVEQMVKEELSEGYYHKLVIFAIHQSVIEELRVRLRKFKPVTLYGGTPPEKRQDHIDRFQKDPFCRVFIGNIQACGTAITLTAANQVIFIEQEWTPASNAQAAMRCHRIGQTEPVFVRCIGVADSIDEQINIVLKRKTKDLTQLFDQTMDPIPLILPPTPLNRK